MPVFLTVARVKDDRSTYLGMAWIVHVYVRLFYGSWSLNSAGMGVNGVRHEGLHTGSAPSQGSTEKGRNPRFWGFWAKEASFAHEADSARLRDRGSLPAGENPKPHDAQKPKCYEGTCSRQHSIVLHAAGGQVDSN